MKVRVFMALFSLFILLPLLALAQGGWVIVPAAAFISRTDNIGHSMQGSPEHYLFVPDTNETPIYIAPIQFPPEADGHTVRKMNVTVLDNNQHGAITIGLYRVNRYSGVSHEVFSVKTAPDSIMTGKTVLTDTSGGYRLIDNQNYTWIVYVTFDFSIDVYSNLRLYSVRIQYQ